MNVSENSRRLSVGETDKANKWQNNTGKQFGNGQFTASSDFRYFETMDATNVQISSSHFGTIVVLLKKQTVMGWFQTFWGTRFVALWRRDGIFLIQLSPSMKPWLRNGPQILFLFILNTSMVNLRIDARKLNHPD